MADLSKYSDENIIDVLSSDAEAELRGRGYDYGWFKKDVFVGSIYILVNPAFPKLVKIGYADDVQKRMKQLSNSSALPDKYHCYAIYKVRKRLEDLQLHKLLDILNPDLRYNQSREFFELDFEKAFSLLSAIAQINGDDDQLVLNPFHDDYFVIPKFSSEHVSSHHSSISQSSKSVDFVIPDGVYYFKRYKKSEKITYVASASIHNGSWTLLAGSMISPFFSKAVPSSVRKYRSFNHLNLTSDNKLVDNLFLGQCSPSFLASLVISNSCDGWRDWKTSDGRSIDVFRK